MARDLGQQHGVLVMDKPHGPTSAACLEKIKKRLKQRKIGHAGTLDPLATGVLVVLLGQGTKLAPYLSSGDKVYQGRLQLGLETDTYDIQGHVLAEHSWDHLSIQQVETEVQAWLNLTEQTVPPYSAAKHQGKPLYALSRAGQDVPEKTKPISIDQVQVLHVEFPFVLFRIRCSSGTYVRSLAHSLGKRLGCGAVLTELVREQVFPFSLDQAHALDDLLAQPETFPDKVLALEDSLPHWPRLQLPLQLVERLKNGNWVATDLVPDWQPDSPGQRALLLSPQNRVVALGEARMHQGHMHWAVLRGLWAG